MSKDINVLRRKATIGGCAAMLSAGLSTLLYSVCLGTIKEEFAMSAVLAGALSTITLIGQALGGIIAGYLADRIGRPKVLAGSVSLVTLAGLIISFMHNETTFAIFRFMAGMGMGACYYLSVIFVGEFYETKVRATKGAVVTSFWNAGYVIVCLMSAYMLEPLGWRWLFRISALPIIVAIWMFFNLEEAPAQQETQAIKRKAKGKNEYSVLFSKPEYIKKVIVWIASRIFYMFGYYAAITWLPNFVQTQVGLSLKSAGWFTAVNYMAMLIGTIIGGYVSEKLGRKRSYIIVSILLGLMAPVVAFKTNVNNIFFIMLIWGFLYGFPTGSSATFMGESWPDDIRGTAVGLTYNLGRIGSWISPILVGFLVDRGSAPMGIASVGIGYVLSALILVPFVKEKEYDMSKNAEA